MNKLIELQGKIEKLQKQAMDIRSKEFGKALESILDQMTAYGISIKDIQSALSGRNRPAKKPTAQTKRASATTRSYRLAGTKVEPRYRGPNGETWSGRGIQPRWLSQLIESGHAKENFLIQPASAELPTTTE
jgi:DNA-binding protein H-NS